ncbi:MULTISPECIES: prolyl oligopeptidase family serine peptidase [unclassified Streptomyces]|uniref:S9 family peptidase n=1 Tax=unclassified Streptomyces TaxID=2593676 RepID=UPI00224D480A|nr:MULTISPECIES: prolyl oligopeptidase family serine peptidase [unclassified Streptomyces]MCX4528649.1 prolyl oligopeptidase family serine peptidase [Streptomyces sp. NBC_01551]MCX4540744.1 prolyl oligopeptidase family serine peptidase [Streptomyces sp. NBC_01565]
MDDFLRLSASTARFTYGAPRAFSFGDDGRLLWFLRSTGPTDAFDGLWVLDTATGTETRLADPRELCPEPGTLPVAERRLRERIRLVAAGIGSYALSGDGRTAVFALYGLLYAVTCDGSGRPVGEPKEIPAAGPVFDPRPDADGGRVAYVSADALYTAPGGRVSPDDGARWGVAEFAAAEELGRSRGHWWSPDGTALLAARVDESALQRRHFADPAHPELPAEDFAYPEAGGPNAEVQLWVLGPGERRIRLDWDAVSHPYVSDVSWEPAGEILLTVQDRLQRSVLLLSADPDTGRTRELSRTTHPQWVDPLPGTPARLPDGRMLTSADTPGGAARALAVDGEPRTGNGIQVRRVAGVHRGGLLVEAGQGDPAEQQVLLLDPGTGALTPVADGPGVHSVSACAGELLLLTSADADGIRRALRAPDGRQRPAPADLSEPLPYRVVPVLERVTEHGIPTALVLPRGHVPGQRLPVLVDGYGGPGFQDVCAEPRRWQARQWWADQGFAVVTVDNRGTPYVSPAFTHAMYRGFSEVTLEDQVAALHALAARHPDMDLGRVGIRGWSYGGYLSALAVLRRPDVFHAAAAGAAPTDFRQYDTAYTERYLGLPQDHPEVYERDSLVPDAPRLTRPLLLVTGLADDNVHPSHTLRLSQALTDAGRPHQLLALPGVTHMTPGGTREKLMALELEFFRRELAL